VVICPQLFGMLTVAAAWVSENTCWNWVGLSTVWLTNAPLLVVTGTMPEMTHGTLRVNVTVTVAAVALIVA